MTSRGLLKISAMSLALIFFFLPCSIVPSLAEDNSIIIIGNRDLPFDTISKKELADIFKQKKTIWENDKKLHIVILNGGETHKRFLWTYLRKTPVQYKLHWKTLLFSGKGRSPMIFRTEKDLMKHVSLTGGAIGYISSSANLGDVKIIKVSDM